MTSTSMDVPAHVAAMVRRPMPQGCCIVPGSTPVVSFGDAATTEVATLGINPSWAEFLEGEQLLTGNRRRLADALALGLTSFEQASDAQIRAIVEDCRGYFTRPGARPYGLWFNVLEKILVRFDASYFNGTACHLDLVQWATRPVWKYLPKDIRLRLLQDGVPHLRAQLRHDNIRLMLLNGRQVIDQVTAVGLVILEEAGALVYHGEKTTRLYRGIADGVLFLGWSVNVQRTPGANSNSFLAQLGDWVRGEWLSRAHTNLDAGAAAPTSVPRGTRVTGLDQLRDVLRRWLASTTEVTLGDVRCFGGAPWLHLQLADLEVVLNADSKRAAVEEFGVSCRIRGSRRVDGGVHGERRWRGFAPPQEEVLRGKGAAPEVGRRVAVPPGRDVGGGGAAKRAGGDRRWAGWAWESCCGGCSG